MKYILVIWFSLIPFIGMTQKIWQGFLVDWTYNHRINRIASLITESDSVFQFAATGIGRDSANLTTWYSELNQSNLTKQYKLVTFTLTGKEKETIRLHDTLIIPIFYSKVTAILQGFDLVSLTDADKPITISVSVKTPIPDDSNYKIPVEAVLQMNCQSLECQWKNEVNYELKMGILCLQSKDDFFEDTISFHSSLFWDKKTPTLKQVFTAKHFSMDRTCGIQSFTFVWNKAHWYATLGTGVSNDGQGWFWYQNWKPAMRRKSYSKQSRFAFAHSGKIVHWELIMIPLLFQSQTKFEKKPMIWMGGNRKPN
ncbi:MAG: hypothetical protein NZ108_02275 [Bacteroidia bacterium]|nr:hypothetical protein [Bacteroidia bacterium]